MIDKVISGLSSTSFLVFWAFMTLGPNALYHWLGNTKSNSKSSVPYFLSNEAILKCQDHLRVELISLRESISTSNRMFEWVIWDELPKCIFENFEILEVKRRQFQNFEKSQG